MTEQGSIVSDVKETIEDIVEWITKKIEEMLDKKTDAILKPVTELSENMTIWCKEQLPLNSVFLIWRNKKYT